MNEGLFRFGGRTRCSWCAGDSLYVAYHDTEWGFPVRDDNRLFERLSLEVFQAGLSWLTSLCKRENFRRVFAGFRIDAVAHFGTRDVSRLLRDSGIVRHRAKIESTINNARRCAALIDEFGSVSAYLRHFEPSRTSRPKPLTLETLRRISSTVESIALAKDLRHRGWRFLGPTTAYAFMQATGLVNDHLHGCEIRPFADRARSGLT